MSTSGSQSQNSDNDYWTVSREVAVRYGWKFRECKVDIAKGERQSQESSKRKKFLEMSP